jgi:HAD superfamily hydrolase (TIGR01509 family)
MNDLLGELKSKGIALLICSNNNEFWFRRQAEKCGFYRFFDSDKIILSNRVGASKWSANFEMFHAVVKAAGVSKEHCLLVDDRAENMERASQFGMQSILFPQNANGYGAQYVRNLLKEMNVL